MKQSYLALVLLQTATATPNGCFNMSSQAYGATTGKPESNFELLAKVIQFETEPKVMSLEVCEDNAGLLSSLQILMGQGDDGFLFLQKIGGGQHKC